MTDEFMSPADAVVEFKRIVTEHLNNKITDEEWDALRELARSSDKILGPGCTFEELSRDQLVSSCFTESNISISDVLGGSMKELAGVIGEINGAPVYYVERSGFYVWGEGENSGVTLDLWITWPAYPPGW